MHPFRPEPDLKTETPQQAWWRRYGPGLDRMLRMAMMTVAFVFIVNMGPQFIHSAPAPETAAVASAVPAETADAAAAAPESEPATAEVELPDTSKLVTTGSATADGPIGPDADTAEGLSIVVQLLRAKEWKLAIGAILMLLLSLTKNFWSFIPKGWKPHFVAASSGLAVVGSGLLAGMGAVEALWAGAQVAAFTSWLYSLAKGLLKKVIPGMKAVPAAPTS